MNSQHISSISDPLLIDKEKLRRNEFQVLVEMAIRSLPYFWNDYVVAVQALANEVTKISFNCGKQPFPHVDEVRTMFRGLIAHYHAVRNLFYLLRQEVVGATLYYAVTTSYYQIIGTLPAFLRSLDEMSEKAAQKRLALAAKFWDDCKAVENLPRNNLQAAIKVVARVTILAADIEDELNLMIEKYKIRDCKCDSIRNWTNEEQDLGTNSVGLIKVTHLCLRKLQKALQESGCCGTLQSCAQLDKIATASEAVSPALIDFIDELYHPVDIPKALENASLLVKALQLLLEATKECDFAESINKDYNQMLFFIQHNYNKLDASAANPVPEIQNLSIED